MKFVLITLVLFLPICVFTQDFDWKLEVAPHGRNVNKIHIYEDGKIFILGGNPESDSIQFAAEKRDAVTEWVVRFDIPGKPMINDAFFKGDVIRAVGDELSYLISDNKGVDWATQKLPETGMVSNLHSIVVLVNNVIYAVGGEMGRDSSAVIFSSKDNGESWEQMTFDLPCLKSVSFISDLIGYSVGEKGTILRTEDAGESWEEIDLVENQKDRYFEDIYFHNEELGFILGGNIVSDSIQTLLRTEDGGEKWMTIIDESGSVLKDVDFLNSEYGVAVGNNGSSLQSSNGGITWESFTLPEVNELWFFNSVYIHNNKTALVGGNVGAVFNSLDYNTLAAKDFQVGTKDILISPNPTMDFVQVQFLNQTQIKFVEIHNALGQKVKTVNGNEMISNRIDLSDLSGNLYYIIVFDLKNNRSIQPIFKL